MASTINLLQAIRAKDFVEAREQFASLIQDKMRPSLLVNMKRRQNR